MYEYEDAMVVVKAACEDYNVKIEDVLSNKNDIRTELVRCDIIHNLRLEGYKLSEIEKILNIKQKEAKQMGEYEKRIKREQIKRLPIGTITITESGAKYHNVYIETPKNSCWLHFYTESGKMHTIPAIQVEDIEWKESWK